MRHLAAIPIILSFVLACGDKEGNDPLRETDADTDADSDTDTDSDTDADTDVDYELDEEHCEGTPGLEDHPGATSYFVGDFKVSGDTWTGTETWLLYATDAWEDLGGADCSITWSITGSTEDGGGACAACDYSVAMDATLVVSATDCPEELYLGEETYSVTYAIDEPGDGSAKVYYAGTGNLLGSGAATSGGLTYVTDPSCTWF